MGLADSIIRKIEERDAKKPMTPGQVSLLSEYLEDAFISKRKLEVNIYFAAEKGVVSEEKGGATFIDMPISVMDSALQFLKDNNFEVSNNINGRNLFFVKLPKK